MKRLVVGFDGSERSRRALQRAVRFADVGATLTVVASIRLTLSAGRGPGPEPVDPDELVRRDHLLVEAAQLLEGSDLDVRTVRGVGDPGRAIVEEAVAGGADLVVVGTRGLDLAGRIALGSVSTHVLHHAPCDVLVVRGG